MKPRVPPAPALDDEVRAILLLGWNAPSLDGAPRHSGFTRQLLDVFENGDEFLVQLWQQHETALREEAQRLHLAPRWRHGKRKVWFGEYLQRELEQRARLRAKAGTE
jgi:hypothetical protein